MKKLNTNLDSLHFTPKCDRCLEIAELSAMRCTDCGGNIFFEYRQENPMFDHSKKGLSRFWSRLPLVNPDARISLGEGDTPLIKVDLGHPNLWLKNEMANPTGSHKDRQLSIAISHAVHLGKKLSALVSAGSTGLANAAYTARAGIKGIIFTGESARNDRVYPIHILGSEVIRVKGDIDTVIDHLTDLSSQTGIYNSSTARHINPYQAEGPKTIAYEIYEQLGCAPDWMIVPAGGGGTYAAIGRGFIELFENGLTDRIPRLVGAVPSTYNALEHGHNLGYQSMAEVKKHAIGEGVPTILAKLAHVYPPDAEDALKMARKINGYFLSASDAESLDACQSLAEKVGLYTEPSSGTGIAVLEKFLASGAAKPSEKVVVMVCGSGFRETNTFSEERAFTPEAINLEEMIRFITR
jgi:threonine synthase